MKAAIATAIQANGTLNALLTGGVHTTREISRIDTPTAFDANNELQPCALVKMESSNNDGPDDTATRDFAAIYLYERDNAYTVILQALPLLRTIFHRQKIGTGLGVWEALLVGTVEDQEDTALEVSMALARLEIVRFRG